MRRVSINPGADVPAKLTIAANTVGAALATTAATTTTPYGFSQAQADGLIARVNALIVDVTALRGSVNSINTALQTVGVTLDA